MQYENCLYILGFYLHVLSEMSGSLDNSSVSHGAVTGGGAPVCLGLPE